MIKTCVFMAFDGEEACQDVIQIAQRNLNSILKGNLEQLMEALNSKMNEKSVVIFNGYAQFFNTDNEDCANNQEWSLINLRGGKPLRLTVERRKVFNDLVLQINNIIQDVVTSANKKGYKYRAGFANWDPWVYKGVSGQMCDPASTGHYPDPEQPELQFFKPPTNLVDDGPGGGELRRRDNETAAAEWQSFKRSLNEVQQRNSEDELHDSILYNSVNPKAEVRHMLDRRSPTPPRCPGDTDADIQPPSIGLPNFIGKMFHPNELGHYTIASWALQTAVDVRAEILGVTPPECQKTDKFTCWQGTGSKAYASESRLNSNYKDFCSSVPNPSGKKGWSHSQKYDEGTPDEVKFFVSLDGTSTNYDEKECEDSMSRIINGCDGNDANNPMNWKFGGEWVRGDWTYQVNPTRENRPWPVIQKTEGSCKGWYHGLWSSYVMRGKGWASYDWGQKTLLSEAKSCIGGGLTRWRFKYFDEPDNDGMEWQADFNTPIWVRNRCFKNNKAVMAAGGFTDGCGGND